MPSLNVRPRALAALFLLVPLASSAAQGLDLTVNHVGLAIGDIPRVTGLRLNFRDRNLERVDGVNVTIWDPYRNARHSEVRGLALGLPITGASEIHGLAAGLFGVGAEETIRGIGIGGIGLGAGGRLEGLMIGGVGLGSGGDMTGIGIGGIGLGSGGNLNGLFFGGIGVGAGGDLAGIAIAGIASGAGGNVRGLTLAGIAAGAGGDVRGITVAGIASGAGGDVEGITVAGIAVGAGGTLRGLSVAGIAVGAPRISGVAAALAVGAQDVRGFVLAPAWFKIERGEVRGVTVSSFNQINGVQRGLAIGIVNYAWELQGVQVGLINIARNNPRGRQVLPIANWHRD